MGHCCASRESKYDVSDIPEEYRKRWNLGGQKMNDKFSSLQKEALQKYYDKKGNEKAYRDLCNKEREEAFKEADANGSGVLSLDEYKTFCNLMCASITKHVQLTIEPIDEDEMEE